MSYFTKWLLSHLTTNSLSWPYRSTSDRFERAADIDSTHGLPSARLLLPLALLDWTRTPAQLPQTAGRYDATRWYSEVSRPLRTELPPRNTTWRWLDKRELAPLDIMRKASRYFYHGRSVTSKGVTFFIHEEAKIYNFITWNGIHTSNGNKLLHML